jgi:four helix bundle protein
MKSYRVLDVYKESKSLAIEIHTMTMTLPKFEMFEEGSQIRQSAKAVTSLIVEGYGRRRYKADFIKYLVYAQSECDETMVHLEFLYATNSFKDKTTFDQLKMSYDSLSKRINKFIQWMEKNLNDFTNSQHNPTSNEQPETGNQR